MSAKIEAAIRAILTEGLFDWVSSVDVIGAAFEIASEDPAGLPGVASDLFSHLIEGELMVPGRLGSQGFESWPGSPAALLLQVIAECESFDWNPMGAGCWLANTDKGNRVARAE